MDRTSNISVLY